MSDTFPTHYVFGYPFAGQLTEEQLQHMLHQGSNIFSDDAMWISFIFNLLHRRKVSQAVSLLFKDDPDSLNQLTDCLNDPEFQPLLSEAIKNPKSDEAKEMERWVSSLISRASKNIPFAGDRSSAAFAQMLAYNRWWGDGAMFLTTAPISWKQALFYRIAHPSVSNLDIRGNNIEELIPSTNAKRKAMKLDSPGADVITFMRGTSALFNDLLNIDMPTNLGPNYSTRAPVPHTQRERGILGAVSALYNATETSLDGNLHTHSKIYGPMSWKYIEHFAANKDLNKLFGSYLDSMIVNELSDDTWLKELTTEFPDPCKIHTNIADIPILTSATLPRVRVTGHVTGFEPDPMVVDSEPNSSQKSNDPTVTDSFWIEFEAVAILVQNHGNHNFSCWKNGSELCRFKLPAHAWNQLSGVIQVELLRSLDKSVPSEFRIKSTVSEKFHNPISRWSQDQRCLIVTTTKCTSNSSTIRDPTNLEAYHDSLRSQTRATSKNSVEPIENGIFVQWNPNLDQQSKNGYFSPCNAIILVVCGGGFGLHNNIQHVGKGGLGENSYIAKYMTKGIGTLTKSLPLLYEALQNLRQSVHPDALQQVHRPAMTALQQSLNNGTKRKEFSLTLMLASLFGMQQFNSSHKFITVNVNFARKEFLARSSKTSVTPNDHDIEMEIQHAEAAAETENVSEIVIVESNRIIPIHASTDYLFRGEDLQHLNFIEYMVLIGKEPIKKQREDEIDIQDKVLLPISRRGGRIANRRYHFGAPTALKNPADSKLIQIHPQSSTHVQYSLSLLKVPLLSGNL